MGEIIMKMENMKKMAIAVIIVGLASLIVGVIGKLIIGSTIAGFSPRGFGEFTVICFLLSINLLLLEKKS
jgi:branched-subunit amino acid ABC-type transport system permease component